MRILITGGTGCLGANIAERYLDRGAQVLCLDNFETSRADALAPHNGLKVVAGSVGDAALVDKLFDEFHPTVVVHSAASYKDPDNWNEDTETNVIGTANVVKAAQRHAVQRFLYLQTALTYGRPQERPVTLAHPLAPFTSYSISKTAGEQYVAISGLPWVSLRLANIYGPRHYSGPIPTFYKRLKAGQKCFAVDTRRDFLEMDDFLRLVDLVIEKTEISGPFNVSSGTDVSIKEIFELLVKQIGITLDEPVKVVPPEGDDVSTLLMDPSETQARFGWKAQIGLDEGIARQVAWFDQYGIGETDL
ncbi:NAD-dependent epimerase/dehydratase family protein, partial [Bosea sp. (in: a-proteobacteria)]|uniref:NAD-dependent epimerase/dehydratase family protein n=1 Tax=Bosea sp. (in: a-proteobacteria) TaxID=1871050 RepID=UPI00122A9292